MTYSKNFKNSLSLRQKLINLNYHNGSKINIRELSDKLDSKIDNQLEKFQQNLYNKQFKRKIQNARKMCRKSKYDYHNEFRLEFEVEPVVKTKDENASNDSEVDEEQANYMAWENFCLSQ